MMPASEPAVAIGIADGRSLCVGVIPAEASQVRIDLLRSFAGVAPVALLIALSIGLVARRPHCPADSHLAERAEAISAQRSHPITLLPETTRRDG
jgi:hypothetical protein